MIRMDLCIKEIEDRGLITFWRSLVDLPDARPNISSSEAANHSRLEQAVSRGVGDGLVA
jgi:hypothetical protein